MNEKYREIVHFMESHIPDKRIDLNERVDSTISEVGYDSLRFIELIVLAEEKFEISISEKDLPEKDTVRAYVQMIYDKMEQNNGDN
jgi:acyl carrier protein